MTEHSARRLVRIAGAAVLVLAVVFQIVGPGRPAVANTPGFRDPVLGFELASRPEHVLGILGGPGDPQREETVRRMNLVNRIDFLFMIAYPAFYVGIASLLAARGRLAHLLASAVLVLAVVMGLADALENR